MIKQIYYYYRYFIGLLLANDAIQWSLFVGWPSPFRSCNTVGRVWGLRGLGAFDDLSISRFEAKTSRLRAS